VVLPAYNYVQRPLKYAIFKNKCNNGRPINFDTIFRYLKHLGYQVWYVRNITNVGHLERDADEGVDKIAR